MGQKDPLQLLMCEKYFDLLKVMKERIIIEINSVLDDKQNAEIRQFLEIGCHIFSVIYGMKFLIKVNQNYRVSSNVHVFFL